MVALRTKLGEAKGEKLWIGRACRIDLRRIKRLVRLSVRKVQEAIIFMKEVRTPSQELFLRALSRREYPNIWTEGSFE